MSFRQTEISRQLESAHSELLDRKVARQHQLLVSGRPAEREDFTGEAARMRDDLAVLVSELEETCDKFEVAKHKRLEREAKKAERLSAKKVLASSPS